MSTVEATLVTKCHGLEFIFEARSHQREGAAAALLMAR
jgi:hypothetical protein